MTGSSWPTSASTFWKKTIQGAILCDQSTCFDSSSCSRKLPAVWKNFFGTIGGRRRAPSSGTRSEVSSAPPRSKYSRIDGTSRTTISSPSIRPTRPSSNVTSRATRPPPPHAGRAERPGRRPWRPARPRRRASAVCKGSDPRTRRSAAAARRGARGPGRRRPGRGSRAAPRARPAPRAAVPKGPRPSRPADVAPRGGRGTRTTRACTRVHRGSSPTPRAPGGRAGQSAGRRRAPRARPHPPGALPPRRRPALADRRGARRPSRRATDLLRRARVDLRRLDEPVDVEVLAEYCVRQPAGRAVVDGGDPVARQHARVREPARDVALGWRSEHLGVRLVERADERVLLLDLRPRSGHVHLALDTVVREPLLQPAHHVEHLAPRGRHRLRRRHAHVQEEVGAVRSARDAPAEPGRQTRDTDDRLRVAVRV